MKNPRIAAALALLLGPLGYLYLGWREALVSSGTALLFVAAVTAAHLSFQLSIVWLIALVHLVLAAQAHVFCTDMNLLRLRAIDDPVKGELLNSFCPSLVMAVGLSSVLLVSYAGALGIQWVIGLLVVGRMLRTVLLALACTVAVWLISRVLYVVTFFAVASLSAIYGDFCRRRLLHAAQHGLPYRWGMAFGVWHALGANLLLLTVVLLAERREWLGCALFAGIAALVAVEAWGLLERCTIGLRLFYIVCVLAVGDLLFASEWENGDVALGSIVTLVSLPYFVRRRREFVRFFQRPIDGSPQVTDVHQAI